MVWQRREGVPAGVEAKDARLRLAKDRIEGLAARRNCAAGYGTFVFFMLGYEYGRWRITTSSNTFRKNSVSSLSVFSFFRATTSACAKDIATTKV